MTTALLGRCLLLALAAIQLIATPFYDFNSRHLFNTKWPSHAKFHCVAYTLLNMGCAFIAGGLVVFADGGTWWAGALLGWAAVLQFIASLFPGVDPSAEGERHWRGWPVSFWGSLGFLFLVALGTYLSR